MEKGIKRKITYLYSPMNDEGKNQVYQLVHVPV